MSTSTELDIDTTTIQGLDFEPGCEHKHHQGDTKRHGGPAEWYQFGACRLCGADFNALVCDQWRKTFSTWARTTYMRATCPTCQKSFLANDCDIRFTRI